MAIDMKVRDVTKDVGHEMMPRWNGKCTQWRLEHFADYPQAFAKSDFKDFGKLIEVASKTDSRASLASLSINFCEVHETLQPFLRFLLHAELEKIGRMIHILASLPMTSPIISTLR